MARFYEDDAELQQAVIGVRKAARRYWLNFNCPRPAGPGGPFRSSRIADSWGHRLNLGQDPAWRRTPDYYSLVYVYRGAGTYYGIDDERPIKAGDVICLFPGVPHAYAPAPDERWDEINVDFAGPAFDAWVGVGLLDPAEPIRHLEPITFWRTRLEDFVGAVARAHGRRLIAAACHMLEETQDSCRAISRRLGFESEFYFSRRFKQLVGMCPKTYRTTASGHPHPRAPR